MILASGRKGDVDNAVTCLSKLANSMYSPAKPGGGAEKGKHMKLISCPHCQGVLWVVIVMDEDPGQKVGLFCGKCGKHKSPSLAKQDGEKAG